LFSLVREGHSEAQSPSRGSSDTPDKITPASETHYDLELHVIAGERDIDIRWAYCNVLFKHTSVERIAASFAVLVEGIVDRSTLFPLNNADVMVGIELDFLHAINITIMLFETCVVLESKSIHDLRF
jgi:hypothetical protein